MHVPEGARMKSKDESHEPSPREHGDVRYARPSHFLEWVKNSPPKGPRPIPTPAPPRPKSG
jgi:hypothetical protein